MTKRQDLCLQRRSRPEQSDQRQPNQAANISHQPRASPNLTPLASRIEFPTMTRGTPKADPVVALIDHFNPISHFSIGGWIASFCAFGTASINSASALLKPAAPADSPRYYPRPTTTRSRAATITAASP